MDRFASSRCVSFTDFHCVGTLVPMMSVPVLMCTWCPDWLGEAEVRGGDLKLPERGAAISDKIQATLGTSIQDWCVVSSFLLVVCLRINVACCQ